MTAGAPSRLAVTPRVWFVDIVRLLASLQMVNGHTIDAVILPALKAGAFFDSYNWWRGLVSVGFLMVSGMAFHVSTLARFERHRTNPAAVGARFRRALVVIAAGYFLGFPWGALSPDPAQASARQLLPALEVKTRFVILQHPKEGRNAIGHFE